MFFKRINFDHDYVLQRTKDNDGFWNTSEKNLYYSISNQKPIIPVTIIFGCGFFFLCGTEGIVGIIFVLLFVKLYCDYNNLKLDIDPRIVKQRNAYKNLYYNKEAQSVINGYKEKWRNGID